MVDIDFVICQSEYFKFKTYCANNSIDILDQFTINNFFIVKISCELYKYRILKKEKWKMY